MSGIVDLDTALQLSSAARGGDKTSLGSLLDFLATRIFGSPVTFTSADVTPSVKNRKTFKTAGTTTITDFDDGVVGQTISILATDSITVADSAAVILNGSANYDMTVTDTLTLTMFNDQVWQEVSRSVN